MMCNEKWIFCMFLFLVGGVFVFTLLWCFCVYPIDFFTISVVHDLV